MDDLFLGNERQLTGVCSLCGLGAPGTCILGEYISSCYDPSYFAYGPPDIRCCCRIGLPSWQKSPDLSRRPQIGKIKGHAFIATWGAHVTWSQLNILVNAQNRAVITDFGSARTVDSVYQGANVSKVQLRPPTKDVNKESLKAEVAATGEYITMTGPAWTIRWAAPELLEGEPPCLASDIWAFGWVCWEVRQCGLRRTRRIVSRCLHSFFTRLSPVISHFRRKKISLLFRA